MRNLLLSLSLLLASCGAQDDSGSDAVDTTAVDVAQKEKLVKTDPSPFTGIYLSDCTSNYIFRVEIDESTVKVYSRQNCGTSEVVSNDYTYKVLKQTGDGVYKIHIVKGTFEQDAEWTLKDGILKMTNNGTLNADLKKQADK